jgi:hypothetical protein
LAQPVTTRTGQPDLPDPQSSGLVIGEVGHDGEWRRGSSTNHPGKLVSKA